MVESWVWDNAKLGLQTLARLDGVSNLEARLRKFIASLSPMLMLVVFFLPLALAPLLTKGAFILMGEGHILLGISIILVGQTLVLGTMAFLFDMCRDKLFQMAWFAFLNGVILRTRVQAEEVVAPTWARRQEILAITRSRAEAAFVREKARFAQRWTTFRTARRLESRPFVNKQHVEQSLSDEPVYWPELRGLRCALRISTAISTSTVCDCEGSPARGEVPAGRRRPKSRKTHSILPGGPPDTVSCAA